MSGCYTRVFIRQETVRCVNPWKEMEMRDNRVIGYMSLHNCMYVVIKCPEKSKPRGRHRGGRNNAASDAITIYKFVQKIVWRTWRPVYHG